jgi:hypothetical protein
LTEHEDVLSKAVVRDYVTQESVLLGRSKEPEIGGYEELYMG